MTHIFLLLNHTTMAIFNKQNTLKSFFLKLLIFFTIIIVADFCIGAVLKKYYRKQQSGNDYLTTYALEKTTADILIFGSSRAVNIVDPVIFEKEMNLTCYNAGRDGESIFYHYAILKSILSRYKPKMILLSFDAGNFSAGVDAYDRLSALLPFYYDHPEIQPIVELKGPFEKLKMISSIYPYNSMLLSIITGNSNYSKLKYATIKGHIPLKYQATGPLKKFDYTNEKELDTIKINTYKSFINECVIAKIPLYIICPPYNIEAIGIDHSITVAKDIASKKNITFFDFTNDLNYKEKPELFADYRHLNYKGVPIITNDIVKKIIASR